MLYVVSSILLTKPTKLMIRLHISVKGPITKMFEHCFYLWASLKNPLDSVDSITIIFVDCLVAQDALVKRKALQP